MKFIAGLSLVLLVISPVSSQASALLEPDLNELTAREVTSRVSPTCKSYNELNDLIRDGKIGKVDAQQEVAKRLAAVRAEYYGRYGKDYTVSEWVFPLAGYDVRAIGGGRRHGFVAGGYDFFSGNRHGGHAAYDIFIRDRNQDSLDDTSNKNVTVLSMTGGIVVALSNEWQPGSRLRGGKYIWVYDPGNDLLVYYAHNQELIAGLGDVVKPGDPLATVGRSGLNAAKRRSPTHLHFSVLKVRGGTVKPVELYGTLKNSRKINL